MKSKKTEEDLPETLVRIRVRERVRSGKFGKRSSRGEKLLLVILGACLGLFLGYLVAGKLIGLLRSPVEEWSVSLRPEAPADGHRRTAQELPGEEIDFDLSGKAD